MQGTALAAAIPRPHCSPCPSARKCKRDLGIFPLHSFLISVCASAGILLLSNTLEFGSIFCKGAAPHSHSHPAVPVSHSGLGAWPQPQRPNLLSPTCPLVWALSTCAHTHTHPQPLFWMPKFANSWRLCEAVGPCLTSLKINNLQLFRRNIWLIFPFHVL